MTTDSSFKSHASSLQREEQAGQSRKMSTREEGEQSVIRQEDDISLYSHSRIHAAVLKRDHMALRSILASLPRPPPPTLVLTEEQAKAAEVQVEVASRTLDRRDVPNTETPLSLAVRLRDRETVRLLCAAGAETSTPNAAGWTPLQDAVCLKQPDLACIILRFSQIQGWARYQRRLPALAGVMARMRNFYMELQWAFESQVVPFIARIAPSDTYRIWKRGPNLRADITLAGFDGLRIKRRRQSLLFFGKGVRVERGPGGQARTFPSGTLLVLHHEKKEVFDALEGAGDPVSDAELAADVAALMSAGVYKAGIDVAQATVQPVLNWRGAEKTETVSGYKAAVYEMQDVAFKLRSRKAVLPGGGAPGAGSSGSSGSSAKPLRDGKDGENGRLNGKAEKGEKLEEKGCRNGEGGGPLMRDRESEEALQDMLSPEERKQLEEVLQQADAGEEEEEGEGEEGDGKESGKKPGWSLWGSRDKGKEKDKSGGDEGPGGKGVGKVIKGKKRKDTVADGATANGVGGSGSTESVGSAVEAEKEWEKEGESVSKRALKPVLWLTRDFPLSIEELIPLLDLLASTGKVKAVQRLKDLLTLKLPPGAVPVKVAVPVVPTIRVQATFSRFEEYLEKESPTVKPLPALPSSSAPGNPPGGGLTGEGKVLVPRSSSRTTDMAVLAGDAAVQEACSSASQTKSQPDNVKPEPEGNVVECKSVEDEFHTPPDSPERGEECFEECLEEEQPVESSKSNSSNSKGKSSWLSWARGGRGSKGGTEDKDAKKEEGVRNGKTEGGGVGEGDGMKGGRVVSSEMWGEDPFVIPEGYVWVGLEERRKREREKARKAALQQQQGQPQAPGQVAAQGKG